MNINEYGFVRVAAASPKVRVADCDYNVSEIKSMIDAAEDKNAQIICFPELSITSYSCGDLFFQTALQQKAVEALSDLTGFMKEKPSLIAIVGGCCYFTRGGAGFCPQNIYSQQQRVLRKTMVRRKP